MMPLTPKDELAQLRARLVRITLLEAPGMILVGLAIYGKFAANPGSLHPLLENSDVTTAMAIVGGVIAAWGTVKSIPIARRIAELQQNSGT